MKENKNIPHGYKDSPLGMIPMEWEVKKLGAVFSQLGNFSFSREQMTGDSQKIRYIHYGDIHVSLEKDSIDLRKDMLPFIFDGLITDEKLANGDFPYLKNGDLILTDASEDYDGVGKLWEIVNTDNQKIVSGLHTILLRCITDEVALGFGRYLFKNPKSAISLKRIAQGTKVYSISYNHISKLDILLPPLPEQQKIAEILSVWDEAIEKQTRLIEKLETRKRGLMQQLLTGKKRVIGFDGEWKKSLLGDFFKERNETGFHHLTLLSVGQEGIYPQTDSKKRDISNDDKSKYKRICIDDIGYNTMRMWQGRSALSRLEGIISPAYTVITPNNQANALFFSYLFKAPKVIHQFWRNSQGLVDDTLNCKFKDFSIVKLPLPSLKEQTAIANILSAADTEIDLAKQKLARLKEQKKGLMLLLLTGKKR